MHSLFIVLKEQVENYKLIRRLAQYEVKTTHAERKLGLFWELINPALQIMIYWLVFGIGLRGNSDVDGSPFILWLVAGLTPWFFVNDSILRGSNSVNSRLGMLMKMKFPLSIIPSYVISSRIYQHLAMILIVILLKLITVGTFELNIIQLPYYMFSTIVFVYSVSLLLSTLVTLIKDIQPLLQSIMRMLFYVTPILWTVDTFPSHFEGFLKLNPIMYLIEGYRHSLIYSDWVVQSMNYSIYFWSVTLLLLIVGASLHLKFRNSFSELV